jgi:hypothetical protein
MNKRIDILVDKTADLMPGVCNIEYESGKLGVEFTEDALEKFVELLINECIEIVRPCKCGCDEGSEQTRIVLNTTIEMIKEHFGIKQ